MSNKCEWKDGKFKGCEGYNNDVAFRMRNDGWTENYNNDTAFLFYYCPFCGADICKPEEKPLIVKSGETWVAHFEGVNYLKVEKDSEFDTCVNKESVFKECLRYNCFLWKPFPEITLDDQIAKSRPMVITEVLPENCPSILYGVSYNSKNHTEYGVCEYNDKLFASCLFRLATPHELQEIPNA